MSHYVSITYLNIGTGYACAGHNMAKLCPAILTNQANLSSDEKVGDLEPTGSVDTELD